MKQQSFDFICLFIFYLFIYFEICTEERFASYILSNEGNIKTSILLILLKCIVVGYSNGNENFTGRMFSNHGLLNILLHFFRYLIYSVFHDFCQKAYEETFSAQISKINFKIQCILQKIGMSNFVILKWRPFEYKVKSCKICPFLGLFSEIKNADNLNFS